MIKSVLVFAFLFSANGILSSQNLIPNPGFEENTGCPDYGGQFYRVKEWNNLLNESPASYFNNCTTAKRYKRGVKKQLGEINPHSGSGFAGLAVKLKSGKYGSQYIQVKGCGDTQCIIIGSIQH